MKSTVHSFRTTLSHQHVKGEGLPTASHIKAVADNPEILMFWQLKKTVPSSEGTCASTTVVFPDALSPAPSSYSTMKTSDPELLGQSSSLVESEENP